MSQPARRFWHGGTPGLQPGERLTSPPARGHALGPTHRTSLQQGLANVAQRPDRVYVTTNRNVAWAFASNWLAPDGRRGGGGLYLVETTSYEPDEDMLSLRDENFQCVEATVILTAGTVKYDARRIHRIIGDATARLERAKRGHHSL